MSHKKFEKESNLKLCRYCSIKINKDAKVCHYCGQDQRHYVQYLGKYVLIPSIVISFFILGMSYLQLQAARNKDIAVDEALKRANQALENAEIAENEAEKIKISLRNFSKIMARTALSLVQRKGRLRPFSDESQEDIKNSIIKDLRQIGILDQEIEEILNDSLWHTFIEFDYVFYILGGDQIPKYLPRELISEWKQLRSFDNIPKPEDLSKFLKKVVLLSHEGKELIEDYDHYIKHHQHRRPEVWRRRELWSHLNKTSIN
ncbi:MAG: hypothetical protein FVQ85_04640 [Planctomycetes bacterium]|nr:hypothetical protein [Planctomycetota bacterium]